MATLTFEVARNRLRRLCAADTEPTLSESDIDDILEAAKIIAQLVAPGAGNVANRAPAQNPPHVSS